MQRSTGGSTEWDFANKEFFEEYRDDPMATTLLKSARDVFVSEGY